jgi:hypothetical protein
LGLLAPGPVLSPTRITLENSEKFRSEPDWVNAFAGASGGEGARHGARFFRSNLMRSVASCSKKQGSSQQSALPDGAMLYIQ